MCIRDSVNAELKEKGISDEAIAKLQPIILLNGSNEEKLATLKQVLSASETGDVYKRQASSF